MTIAQSATPPTTDVGSLNDIVPYKKIPLLYPNLVSFDAWPWLVKNRNNNGLGRAFHKIGKSLFVNTTVLWKSSQ